MSTLKEEPRHGNRAGDKIAITRLATADGAANRRLSVESKSS
jgi:hypothetical protein